MERLEKENFSDHAVNVMFSVLNSKSNSLYGSESDLIKTDRIIDLPIAMLCVFMTVCVCCDVFTHANPSYPIPLGAGFPGVVCQDGSHRTKMCVIFREE